MSFGVNGVAQSTQLPTVIALGPPDKRDMHAAPNLDRVGTYAPATPSASYSGPIQKTDRKKADNVGFWVGLTAVVSGFVLLASSLSNRRLFPYMAVPRRYRLAPHQAPPLPRHRLPITEYPAVRFLHGPDAAADVDRPLWMRNAPAQDMAAAHRGIEPHVGDGHRLRDVFRQQEAIHDEIRRQMARARAARFPRNAEAMDEQALREMEAEEREGQLDVHSDTNTEAFNRQFAELKNEIAPHGRIEDIDFPRLGHDVRTGLADFIDSDRNNNAHLRANKGRINTAIEYLQNHGQVGGNAMTYGFNGGEALAYVWRSIRNKATQAERDKGMESLALALEGASGRCNTRHASEVLDAHRLAYAEDPNAGMKLSFEDARDMMEGMARRILPRIAARHLTEQAEKDAFAHALRQELRLQQNVPQAHADRYIDEFALAHWDLFKEQFG